MAAAVDAQGVGDVDRLRFPHHRQIAVVAQRFVARQDERRIAEIDAVERRSADAEQIEAAPCRTPAAVLARSELKPTRRSLKTRATRSA